MSNKNEVFEYLIDQLRQQVNKKDTTSFNVSVRISDLDEVKQVIHNLQQHIAGKDDEIRALKDSLRQQVNNNQCEDLAHEVQSLKSELARYKKPYIAYVEKTNWVQGDSRFLKKWGKHRADLLRECIQEQDAEIQSLKNQLRDAQAQIKELQEDNIKKSEHISHLSELVDELMGTITLMNGDVEAYKLLRKGGFVAKGKSYVVGEHAPSASVNCRCTPAPVPQEQSGCRKEDTQGCKHEWQFYRVGFPCMCLKCGLKK